MFYPLSVWVGLRYTRAERRNHFISFISFISTMGITLGVIVLITVLSVMNGFHKEVRERILGMASHADIQALSGGLKEWQQALEKALRHPRVIGAAPYVESQTMLVHGRQVSGAVVRGIDPELESAVVDVAEHMQQGSLKDLAPGSFNIVLGRELALVLGVRVGDKVTLARVLQMKGKVSGIRLKLDDVFAARQVSLELAREFRGYFRVTDWTDQHRNFFAALKMEKRMMGCCCSSSW